MEKLCHLKLFRFATMVGLLSGGLLIAASLYLDQAAERNYVEIDRTTISNVPVIIFRFSRRKGETKRGALVYFHGGAFISGSPDTYFLWTKKLALETGATVISVDYRLAPKHPFPAAIEDCLKVTKAVFDEADKYGIDPDRIMVGGDSAGGNLAGVVAIQLPSSKYYLKGQLLLSPILQAADFNLPSYKAYGSLFPEPTPSFIAKYAGLPYNENVQSAILAERHLTEDDKSLLRIILNVSMASDDVKRLFAVDKGGQGSNNQSSFNKLSKSDEKVLAKYREVVLDKEAWPLLTWEDKKLRLMCQTFISVAEFDPLRDEALLYYDRLQAVLAKVTLSFMRGAYHAGPIVSVINGEVIPENSTTAKYIDDMMAFVRTHMT